MKKTPLNTPEPLNSLLICRRAIIATAIFSFFINILMLTVPLYMLQVFDRVLASFSYDTLIYLTLIAIVALMVFGILELIRSKIMITAATWLDTALAPKALLQAPDEILRGNRYGAHSLNDIDNIRQFIGGSAIFSLFDAPWSPIYLLIIFLLHPILGAIAIIGAIVLFILAVINDKITRKPIAEANALAISTQNKVQHAVNNAEVIQAMGIMPGIVNSWKTQKYNVLKLQQTASEKSSLIMSISKFTRLTLQILMLGVGAFLVINSEITAGVMIVGSIILSRALAPIEQSISVWKQMLSAKGAYDRLTKHFSTTIERNSGIKLPKAKGNLKIEGLFFAAPDTNKLIINNVNMSLKAGDSLAIIGPSAAGKSTLARLIVGAYKPSKGVVRLDEADVYNQDRVSFGENIGYLPQDVELFDGTVKDNISRMQPGTDEDILQAAQMAGVHEMILRLDNGYETVIGPNTNSLSAGQMQRLALARALYKSPKLIVLDEPNSNLDSEGEMGLLNAIKTAQQIESTLIVITHRPALLQNINNILVLQQGQIKLAGSKDEVMEKMKQAQQQAQQQ